MRNRSTDWFTAEQLAASAIRHRRSAAVRPAREAADLAVPLVFLVAHLAERWWPGGHAGGSWVAPTIALVAAMQVAAVPHRLVLDALEELQPQLGQQSHVPGSQPPTVPAFVASFAGLTLARLAASAAVAVVGLAIVRSAHWWPLAVWSAGVVGVVCWAWAAPRLIVPIVDRAVPLDRADLRARLAELAARAGVPLHSVLVGRSGATAGEAACVVGLGSARRLVVDGGVLDGAPDDVDVVVAHELGHVRLRHSCSSLVAVATLGALAIGAMWLIGAVSGNDLAQPAAVPLWLFVLRLTGLLGGLVLAALSRRQEQAADGFAACLVGPDRVLDHLRRHLVDSGADLDPSAWARLVGQHPAPADRLAHLSGMPARRRVRGARPAVMFRSR